MASREYSSSRNIKKGYRKISESAGRLNTNRRNLPVLDSNEPSGPIVQKSHSFSKESSSAGVIEGGERSQLLSKEHWEVPLYYHPPPHSEKAGVQ
uniref:Uncharacterized protein n=1 Tax=Ditylenchus dipsaci TaxID=166011 RepID=A0A915DJ96_9BILA